MNRYQRDAKCNVCGYTGTESSIALRCSRNGCHGQMREHVWDTGRPYDFDVKVRVVPGGRVPFRATDGASGLDLFARLDSTLGMLDPVTKERALPTVIVHSGSHELVPVGICIEVTEGYEAQVRPRSGLAVNGVVPCFGTIDSDYRGEVKVNLFNFGSKSFVVRDGDRVAQLAIAPVAYARLVEVPELSEAKRGAAGFGSTGK